MAMKVALDTNRYVDFCRGDTEVTARLQEATEVFLPFVTLAELRAGFLCGTKGPENEKTLAEFLDSRRVSVLYADDETTRQYARLFLQLRT